MSLMSQWDVLGIDGAHDPQYEALSNSPELNKYSRGVVTRENRKDFVEVQSLSKRNESTEKFLNRKGQK